MAPSKVTHKLPDMGNDWLLPVHMYIILSPSQSTPDTPMFWGRFENGYTQYLSQAGVYSASEVLSQPLKFNDGFSAVAIPLTETAMRKLNLKITIDYSALDAFANRAVAAK